MSTATVTRATPAQHHRFHLLDALRGVVAILVVFWHAPRYAKLPSAHNTYLAVDFFFCLSGFVIAFAYEGRLRNGFGLQPFLAARLIRLYPVYFAGIASGLLISLLSMAASRSATGLLPCLAQFFCFQAFMLPSLPFRGNPWLFPLDFPAWSLFFELLANLAYAWLVRNQLARNSHLLLLFGGCVLAMALWPARTGGIDVGAMHLCRSLLGVPRVLLSFLGGVLAMRLSRRYQLFTTHGTLSVVVALAITLCVILLLLGPFHLSSEGMFPLLTITVLFPALVYLGALCRLPSAWTGVCSLLGDLSYPVYLFHVHFLRLLENSWTERTALSHPLFKASLVPAVVLLSAATSVLILKKFDLPVRTFLTRTYNATRRLGPVVA